MIDNRPTLEVMDYFWGLCVGSTLDGLKKWKKHAKEGLELGKISQGKITELFNDVIDLHIQAREENKDVEKLYFALKGKSKEVFTHA